MSLSSSSPPEATPSGGPAYTQGLKWKLWVTCRDSGILMPLQPIVCVEQDLVPGVDPPFAMTQLARFTLDHNNKLNMRSEALAFSKVWQQALEDNLPLPKALHHFPFTTTAVLDAMCLYPVQGNEQILSATVLDPSTAFGPHDNRISFGVIDISEQVVYNSWSATIWRQPWICFTFPFGMHKQDLSPRIKHRVREPLSADHYAEVFRGEIDMVLKNGRPRDFHWPPNDDSAWEGSATTLDLVRPLLHSVWPQQHLGVSWRYGGAFGRKQNMEFPDGDREDDPICEEDRWFDFEGPEAYEHDDNDPIDLHGHPEKILKPEGARLLSEDMHKWVLDLATPGLLYYFQAKKDVVGVLSGIPDHKRSEVEVINVSVMKSVDTDILVWLPRWFPNLKQIMIMHGERTMNPTKCFEELEKTLVSQMKIYRIDHQALYTSSLLGAPQLRGQNRPYYPVMNAQLFGQVTQIIFASVRTSTNINDEHDWLRLESGGLGWDLILREGIANDSFCTDDDMFWACIPCREVEMRGPNWMTWWPKLMYFFKNQRICNPYGSSSDTASRSRFLQAFAYCMSHPLDEVLRRPGDERSYTEYDEPNEIHPIPLGPYQQAAEMKESSTEIEMQVESWARRGAFTLVVVAEDNAKHERVLRYGFVTTASPATLEKPIEVMSLARYRKFTDAPTPEEQAQSPMQSSKYSWSRLHDQFKMDGPEHVCALDEVESVLGPDLSTYFARARVVDDVGNVVD